VNNGRVKVYDGQAAANGNFARPGDLLLSQQASNIGVTTTPSQAPGGQPSAARGFSALRGLGGT
jgi:hypothetical protein